MFSSKKTILDLRDGWSISIKHGYGGLKRKSLLKSWVARAIEFCAFKTVDKVVCCTPGLYNHHKSLMPKDKIRLILNGYQNKKNLVTKKTVSVARNFICLGKFSEYGRRHVKKALHTINKRYGSPETKVTVYGADIESNMWVEDFIKREALSLSFSIQPRITKEKLTQALHSSDVGISILRDPSYELGTKVYEYINHGLPILNYFEGENEFTRFFKNFLDDSLDLEAQSQDFHRPAILEKNKDFLIF